ncbi:MAG: A/G-specific adenine glycosylase [Bacteroidota bacterium]
MEFHESLREWYLKNHRDLPWRANRDPYQIWLSEIILQQTRVDQGIGYYHRFLEQYPTVNDLAGASEDAVLKLWQGLGYYSRARNLHYTARFIRDEYGGKFPSNHAAIRQLKGVGDYTAAAIASFAFGLPHAAVDGNVMRVLSRIFGLDEPIDSTAGKKAITQLAHELIDPDDPATFNQGMMEFGALQCVPRQPACPSCTFIDRCAAFATGRVADLPVKRKKTASRDRYFHYLVISWKGQLYLRKRTGKGIWQNLHEFPLVETPTALEPDALPASESWQRIFAGTQPVVKSVSPLFKHILSHQRIHARFWQITLPDATPPKLEPDVFAIPADAFSQYAVPRLIERYMVGENLSAATPAGG